jgi:O-antigen/teichoic acid export membrane protein
VSVDRAPVGTLGHVGAFARRSLTIGPLAAASLASLANSLVIAVVYSRVAGAAAFGVYQIALASTSVAGVLAISGSATAATRAAAQGRNAVWPLFRARLPFCALASAALGSVALALAFAGRSSIAAAIGAAAFTLPAYLGGDVYPAHLLGERRYGDYLRLQLATQALTAVAVVSAVAAAPSRPWIAVVGMTTLTGAIQLAGTLSAPRTMDAANDIGFARRMTGVSVAGAVDARLDVLLAGSLLGSREAGLVAVARIAPAALKNIWMAVLYQPFFTRMAAETLEGARDVARRYRRSVALVSAAACGLLIAVVPVVLPSVFGEPFSDATLVAQLLLAAVPLHIVAGLDKTVLRAQAFTGRETMIHVALAIVSLVAMPPLIFVFGITGIGIEALVSGVVYVFLARRFAREVRAERFESPASAS